MVTDRGQSAGQGSWHPKAIYPLLLALSMFGLVLRYPFGAHQLGVDSWSIDALTTIIRGTGRIPWLLNGFSYFGLSPFSYSPAVPVSLAAFEEISGIQGELAVLLYSLFLGAVLPLTSFVLGYVAFRRGSTAIAGAFLISTSAGMIGVTNWTVATRGAFLAFTPLALALLLRIMVSQERRAASGFALVVVSLTLALTHAMFLILLPAMLAAYVLYRVVVEEGKLLRHRTSLRRRNRLGSLTLGVLFLGFAAFIAVGPTSDMLSGFPAITSGAIPNTLVTRIGLQWASILGLGALLIPVGMVQLSRLAEKRKTMAIASVALTFLPLTLNPVYGILVATPAVLLIAGLGLVGFGRHSRRPIRAHWAAAVAMAIGLAIVVTPLLVTIPRSSGVPCGEPDLIDSQTYNAGLYLRHVPGNNFSFVWDDHIEAQRLEAVSGRPSVEPIESIGDLGYSWIARNITIRFQRDLDYADFLASGHSLLVTQEWLPTAAADFTYYWGKHSFILEQNVPESPTAQQILRFYRASYAIDRCASNQTPFYQSMASSRFALYEDELQRAYWVQGYS